MILGTAGHVDHGKTALVKALTGVDTDRLEEERRRGLTIELGFAPLILSDGTVVSMVDVPGHEKFIPTMLSGCAGMDIVLLAVAADQGPMPQTREHLAILSLLGLRGGVIALTRADLGLKSGVEEQTRALVKGTFLEQAPILPTSVVTGEGLAQLRQALERLVRETPPPECGGACRLHVDRVFSVAGSGTVVTGTLTGGPIRRGDTVRLWPGERTARVRGLQCHGVSAEELAPGCRAAVNLAGVHREQVKKGDTLAPLEGLTLTQRLDTELKVLPHAPYPIKNNSVLHVHHGGRELVCRCILLGRDRLEPGERGFAQLRLENPLAARAGDRFVVRFFSPVVTVGGGCVLDLAPPARGRMDPDRLGRLALLAGGKALPCPKPAQKAPLPPPLVEVDSDLEEELCARYRQAGLEPPSNEEMEEAFPGQKEACRRVGRALADRGILAPLSPKYRAWGASCTAARDKMKAQFGTGLFTLAQARDALGISRKYALLLLEYWDRVRVTQKMGEGRKFV